MTKAELIRKLAKRSGVPDSEAKFFFELFLKKVSIQLNPGETIKVKGIGYFQLRTGRIKRKNSDDRMNEDIYSDFMVFYPLSTEAIETAENIIFNIPVLETKAFNLIDSYFSLSFGKPVIPLKNTSTSEFFIPLSGIELRRLAELKTEKLLQEIELVSNYAKGNEILLIETEDDSSQIEIDWENLQNNLDQEYQRTVTPESEENISVSWDFGENLDRELEEESILDTGTDDSLFVSYEDLEREELNWDFGEGGNVPADMIEDEEIPPQNPMQQRIEAKTISQDSFVPDSEEEELLKFQRVNSLTSEINIPESDNSWNFGGEDLLKQTITEEINEEGFAEIKNRNSEFPFMTDISQYSDEELKLIKQSDNRQNRDFDFPDLKETDMNEEKIPSHKIIPRREEPVYIHEEEETALPVSVNEELDLPPQRVDRTLGYNKKSGLGFFVISAIILLFAIGFYMYSKYIDPLDNKKEVSIINQKTSSSAVIIERNFEVPVTYPYSNDLKLNIPYNPYNLQPAGFTITPPKENQEQIPDSKVNQVKEKIPEDKIIVPKKTEEKITVPKKTEIKTTEQTQGSVKVKEFIYKKGDKYLVQVSSWSNLDGAQRHVAELKSKGHTAEIEKVELSIGTRYRVKAGMFNTLEEAEKFYNNNR